MARVTTAKAQATRTDLLEAANQVLHAQGYAGLTTRGVAGVAGVPMSQIQYHFGSKEGMVLALFEYMNARLLERQNAMFADPNLTLSEQWDLACDYLDDDLATGYVRVLQELLAAGWADPEIGRVVRDGIMGWVKLLTDLAGRARENYGSLGFSMLALSFSQSDPSNSQVYLYTFYQAGIIGGALYEMNKLTRNQNSLEDFANGYL